MVLKRILSTISVRLQCKVCLIFFMNLFTQTFHVNEPFSQIHWFVAPISYIVHWPYDRMIFLIFLKSLEFWIVWILNLNVYSVYFSVYSGTMSCSLDFHCKCTLQLLLVFTNWNTGQKPERIRPLFIFRTQIKIFLMKSERFLTLHRQKHNYHVQCSER